MGQASVARDSELLGCPSGTWWNWWREAPQRSRGAVPKRGETTEVTMGSEYHGRPREGARVGQTWLEPEVVKCSSGYLSGEEKSGQLS